MLNPTPEAAAVSKIEALDTSVFAVDPAAHPVDRVSLLRIQRVVRRMRPNYTYVEIGSDMGASLLPHLLDPLCRAAISIDLRPEATPDERAIDFPYVSTAWMLAELARHASPAELAKLSTFESDASAVDFARLAIRPELAFIDAEHTNPAAFSDFLAILPMVADDSIVAFHDANLVCDAIRMIDRLLTHQKKSHKLLILPSCIALFAFGALADEAEAQLAPHAIPSDAYLAISRQKLQFDVADAVVRRTYGLPGESISELIAWTAEVEQKLGGGDQRDPSESRVVNDDSVRAASLPVAILAHVSDVGDTQGSGGSIDYSHRSNRSFEVQGLSISSRARVLEYKAQYQDGSWSEWVEEGTYLGGRGTSDYLRGVAVRVKSDLEKWYSVRTSCRFRGVGGVIVAQDGKDMTSKVEHPLRAIQVDLYEVESAPTAAAAS